MKMSLHDKMADIKGVCLSLTLDDLARNAEKEGKVK